MPSSAERITRLPHFHPIVFIWLSNLSHLNFIRLHSKIQFNQPSKVLLYRQTHRNHKLRDIRSYSSRPCPDRYRRRQAPRAKREQTCRAVLHAVRGHNAASAPAAKAVIRREQGGNGLGNKRVVRKGGGGPKLNFGLEPRSNELDATPRTSSERVAHTEPSCFVPLPLAHIDTYSAVSRAVFSPVFSMPTLMSQRP